MKLLKHETTFSVIGFNPGTREVKHKNESFFKQAEMIEFKLQKLNNWIN